MTERIRLIFLGSDDFSLPSLKLLHEDPRFEIALVISQPDKRRKRKVLPTPIKAYALAHGLDQMTPDGINDPAILQTLQALKPDFLVVVAYGQIIGKRLLQAFPDRIVNLHGSLLPAYRGAAPIQRALLAGDQVTGNTTMLISRGLDQGDMLAKAALPIADDDDLESLTDHLATEGAQLLRTTLLNFDDLYAKRQAQDESRASYADKIQKDEGWLDFHDPVDRLVRQVKTYKDWPGARFSLAGETYKIYQAQSEAGGDATQAEPGQVVSVDKDGIRIQAGDGLLTITQIQAPGKRVMAVSDFLNGHSFPLEKVDPKPAPEKS